MEVVEDAYSFPSLISIPTKMLVLIDAYPWFLKVPHEPLINSGGHGSWIKTGPRQFTATVQYYQLDPNPSLNEQAPNPNLDSNGKVRKSLMSERNLTHILALLKRRSLILTVTYFVLIGEQQKPNEYR